MVSICCKQWCVFGTGTVFVLSAGILLILWPSIFRSIIKDELVLTNNSRSFDMWKETPIPMYLEIYLYNFSNYADFKMDKKNIKPYFEECGPYIFKEKHIKTNLTWNSNNETITFMQNRIWEFEPEMSKGSLDDDKITNINVITATVAYNLRFKHILIRHAVDFLLREKKELLVNTKTPRELLFDGYDDPLIDMMEELNVTTFKIPYDKFGWFYPRNNSYSYDGVFNMHTGVDKLKNLGKVYSWNYKNKTNFYQENSECNMINGTTGEIWPPFGKASELTLFISDFCRSVTLDYAENYEKHGLVGRKYIGTESVFDNGTAYPEASCFSNGEILPSGVLNVSLCRFGAPAFVSYPHFYLADPVYRSNIDGMKPDKTLHEMFMALEPNTGMPLEVRAQLQINIMVQAYEGISLFNDLKRTFVPMMWFRQTAELTGELADEAKTVVLIPSIGNYTLYGFGAIGFLIIAIGLYLSLSGAWMKKDELLLNTNDDSTSNHEEYIPYNNS